MEQVLHHPDYLKLLFDGLSLFRDSGGGALLVVPGELPRNEMVDRAWMVLAPLVGDDVLTERCAREVGTQERQLLSLALRVDWRSLVEEDGILLLAPRGDGEAVTTLTLRGLVELEELAEPS